MQPDDFDFNLPTELIAQYPLKERSASRLLCLDKDNGIIRHRDFKDLPNLLNPGDLLVFNDTRVIPARLFARKVSGGKVSVLLERILSEKTFLAHLKANKPLKIGTRLILTEPENNKQDENTSNVGNFLYAVIMERKDDLFVLELEGLAPLTTFYDLLEKIGHIPLPPYIKRYDKALDRERYQTIFAREKGAVAAPTAGLHFDDQLLKELQAKGIERAFVTLHVGAGTFQPLRVANIKEHKMHRERIEVSQETVSKIMQTKERGGRVIAVGTTVVRSLETAAQNIVEPDLKTDKSGFSLQPFQGETDIFIYPGYKFRCIDGLITNFHLPKSTLLMLVAAFAGLEPVKRAYQEAIAQKYRFFSYGDAMLVI